MDKLILEAWDKNNSKIKDWLKSVRDGYLSYEDLLRMTISIIFDGFEESSSYWSVPDKDRISVIDHGDYQGTTVYVIAGTGYQPGPDQHWYTHNYYGSCSGCDALLSITDYTDGPFSNDQIEGIWTLCLHLMQNMKRMVEE